MSTFEKLNAINVNDHTEKKNGLTYLSWAWAWAEVKKEYPDASYKVWKDELGRPYIRDEELGYMVSTSVTIDGETLEMWLPVMDSGNNAMKPYPYSFKTPYGKEKNVAQASMFDVNKAIMRCLVKNLAMFGLGLYIYSGEDLPDVKLSHEELVQKLKSLADVKGITEEEICKLSKKSIKAVDEMTDEQLVACMEWIRSK